ncbi:MAG: 2-oxo acid dehydrogenase subunit E2 [Candidatus Lokiarchaeota archaeon]|nr:2-oxo acid dehydrogenase subunit E2 [Candidatus Lokiarchaeota archaeon]
MGTQKNYTIRKFSPTRRIMTDYYEIAGENHRVMGLVELDISKGRKRIRELKEAGNKVSLTSWVAKCVGKAVSEDKRFNTFHKGNHKIITFNEVDMSVMVEIPKKDGGKVPFNHCVRNIDKKSILEINNDIRKIQEKKIEETEQLSRDSSAKYTGLYMLIPTFIRRIAMRQMLRNPFYVKKIMGTVGISTIGETFKGNTGWAVGFGDKTLNVILGGIVKRVVETENGIEGREFYCMTFLFDHSLVDGAPCAAFVARVAELLKEAYGLKDINAKD